MYNLIYVSQATRPLEEHELSAILKKSRNYNTKDAITGLLIYKYSEPDNRGNFMQLLEGEETAVQNAFARIRADQRHHTKIVLVEGEIAERHFPGWSMSFRNIASADLEKFEGYSDLGSEQFWGLVRDEKLQNPLNMLMSFYEDDE